MTSIWVVEQGSYSDYCVVGVFSTEENAKFVADSLNKSATNYDRATVAEWELDPGIDRWLEGRELYTVTMLRDGTTEEITKQEWANAEDDTTSYVLYRSGWPQQELKDVVVVNVFATSEEHAVKIANERRVQLIASGEWK